MSDPIYPAFQILAFIAFVLVLIPLPWHLQAWNAGTCLFMMWTAMALLNLFINSIIWHNNVIDWAPIWCDISTRIILASGVGINAASLCISRRLYKIAACQTVATTSEDKRRALLIDLGIGLGLPLLQLPLHIIVNGHRYNILEDSGCQVATYNTVPAYPLTFLWPNAINFASIIYCILTLRCFIRRRAQFTQFLSSSSALNANRYFRLIALASIEIVINVPISSYGLYLNISRSTIQPWVSWDDTHFNWLQVDLFPAVVWRHDTSMVAVIEVQRWSTVLVALVFFGFFGFAEEARKHYRLFARFFGLSKLYEKRASSLKPFHLPLHQKPTSNSPKRCDSITSSTVVASPTYQDFKSYQTKVSDGKATYANSSFGALTERDEEESFAFAVYSPSSSPVAMVYPTSPSPEPRRSVYTVPSLSAFPEPPLTHAITRPGAALPKYSTVRHSSGF